MKMIFFFLISFSLFAKEKIPTGAAHGLVPKNDGTSWEILAQLKYNAKTKKAEIKGDKLKNILGKNISIKGFMMPLDYSNKEISEFLLMPYVPSCEHVPPPPANQIVYVKMKVGSKAKTTYYPIEVKGILSVDESKDFESSYKIIGETLKELK